MRIAMRGLLALGLCTLPGVGALAAETSVEGRIRKFECGDNCYLTIVDAAGHERTGLCEARACTPWLENAAMPHSFVGRRVRATTGVGVQHDDAGNAMGKMLSFKKIEFLK